MSDSEEEVSQEEEEEEEDIETELKNKIKILKKAFVKEREEHTKLQKKYENLEQTNKQLEMLVMEKESACKDLIKQTQSLQEVILHEQMRIEELTNLKSNQSGRKTIFGKNNKQSSEMLQIQADNSTLKRQIQQLEEKIQNLQGEVEGLKKDLASSNQSKLQLQEKFDQETEEKEKAMKSLNRDLKNALQSNSSLIDTKSQLEEQITQLNKKLKNQIQENEQLIQQQKEKEELIQTLQASLQKHITDVATLANKMMSMKNQLAQAQSNLQIFNVLKQGRLMNSSAQLRLIKDSEQFILEICNLGKTKSYLATDINSVQLIPEENNLFILLLNSERDPFTFESNEASMIVKKFREFLQEAMDEQRINGGSPVGKQKLVLQNLSQFL